MIRLSNTTKASGSASRLRNSYFSISVQFKVHAIIADVELEWISVEVQVPPNFKKEKFPLWAGTSSPFLMIKYINKLII